MSLALAFWIGMFIWLVFGLWSNWPIKGKAVAGDVLLFVLLLLLGWKTFGPSLHT